MVGWFVGRWWENKRGFIGRWLEDSLVDDGKVHW